MTELDTVAQFLREFGLPITILFLFGGLILTGKLRTEREVDRERQISDGKDALIGVLTSGLKDNTTAMDRIASGIEERNRIETTMRGRRT